jgi:hypothetical protein
MAQDDSTAASPSTGEVGEPVRDTVEEASAVVEEAPERSSGQALLSRLHVIEDQPIATRAEAYAHVHDELRDVLEGGDVARAHD